MDLLIDYIKANKKTVPVWGKLAHIAKTVDWDSPKADVSQFVKMSQDHTSFNCSVIGVDLQGIVDLDTEVALHHESLGKEIASLVFEKGDCIFVVEGGSFEMFED